MPLTPRERQWRGRGMKGPDVSEKGYAMRLSIQKGGCFICGRRPKTRRLAWDHDHRTGQPRDLLCFRCNRMLLGAERMGGLPMMRKAVAYLERWEAKE